MTIVEHYTARTRGGARCLLEPDQARWLWDRLRHNFPSALACVLMPDHLHLVARSGERTRLVRVLAAFTVRFGVRFDVIGQPANTTAIATRAMRYVFLNPVRAGLVDDPWKWRWSTLRDLAGAAYPLWTALDEVASVVAIQPMRLLDDIASDANARSMPPRRVPIGAASIDALRASVAAALRWPDDAVCERWEARRLVVQAHHAIAQPGIRKLAKALGRSERTIRRDRAARSDALDAVLVCLCDSRLRHGNTASPRPKATPSPRVPDDDRFPATIANTSTRRR